MVIKIHQQCNCCVIPAVPFSKCHAHTPSSGKVCACASHTDSRRCKMKILGVCVVFLVLFCTLEATQTRSLDRAGRAFARTVKRRVYHHLRFFSFYTKCLLMQLPSRSGSHRREQRGASRGPSQATAGIRTAGTRVHREPRLLPAWSRLSAF